jgi:protein-tyrosine phosphatase
MDPAPKSVYSCLEFMPRSADRDANYSRNSAFRSGKLAEYEACRDEMVKAIPSLVEFIKRLAAKQK